MFAPVKNMNAPSGCQRCHDRPQVGRFRLLGATLPQMPGWCNDLAYACALSTPVANLWRPSARAVADLEATFAGRDAWLVCNATPVDEEAMLAAHEELAREFPVLLTVYAPLDGTRAAAVARAFERIGVATALASALPKSSASSAASAGWCAELQTVHELLQCRRGSTRFVSVFVVHHVTLVIKVQHALILQIA
jgi:hypothetical protein